MALNLLIADPDNKWLSEAKAYFEELSYQVKAVENGKDAQISLYKEKFFAVVLNDKIKEHTSRQVLTFIKANCPEIKIVLLSDKQESEEEKTEELELNKMEKSRQVDVLQKPFELKDIKILLESYQSIGDILSMIKRREEIGPEEECDIADAQFSKIKIDQFYAFQPVLFDIFIKLTTNRYIKILHAGDMLSRERMDKYATDKKVEYLYFKKEDLHKYIKFSNRVSKDAITSEKISSTKKIKLLQHVSEKFLEHSFEEGIKPQILEQGKEVVENVYLLIQSNKELYKILRDYQDFDPSAFSHAYLTSLFSSAIIKQFEWQSKTTLECIALACFFHDIGKMKSSKELLHLKVEDMTEEQFEKYRHHPQEGYKMLETNNTINNSVKQIILQHHEHIDGSGFPFARKGSKILTLSNIVCLADRFVHIIQEEELKPVDALKTLLERKKQLVWFNSIIVENLIKVFVNPEKKDPPKPSEND
ncbi:MAG: HD domain-containing protein [Halobacteriovoraceae bacterium]|nr:HD domain-containing protein [Halobacteriovoraceae bacterium]